jgi:hypothetical protein
MILCVLPVSITGYATMANMSSATVRFGMTCLMAIGMYASVPCILVWNSNNSAGHYKRATTSALQLEVANSGGFVASRLSFALLSLLFLFTSFSLPLSRPAGGLEIGVQVKELIVSCAAFIYPNSEAPLYHKGHTIVLGLLVYAWFA